MRSWRRLLTAIAVFLVAGNVLVDLLRSKNLQHCSYSRVWNQAFVEIGEDPGESASDVDDMGAWVSPWSAVVSAGRRGPIDGVPDASQIDALLDGADLSRPPPCRVGGKALI
ncbi:MAG TPA: hypothetical protein ENJ16_03280 [Planctomycetaceae bacterium]|nr:hypothetical protein [Planctomycetaceae bacterium]